MTDMHFILWESEDHYPLTNQEGNECNDDN